MTWRDNKTVHNFRRKSRQ